MKKPRETTKPKSNQTYADKYNPRKILFKNVNRKQITAVITSQDNGILAGMKAVKERAQALGLIINKIAKNGAHVKNGDIIARVTGSPEQIAQAEENLIGLVAKPSGIATAAHKAVQLAEGRFVIACGAWKKMPPQIKDTVREALNVGGAKLRITNQPFIYLDKNYVRILGGISAALVTTQKASNRTKVIQLKGETKPIAQEAEEAALNGANIIMIDTGNPDDVDLVSKILHQLGLRNKIKIAFAGNIKLDHIPNLRQKDIDILDIGREIIDAPLLDMKLDVIKVENSHPENPTPLELNLLEKTELYIENITLQNANLTQLARVAARALQLEPDAVIVTDIRDNTVTLDILRKTVTAEQIFGKQNQLLQQLAQLPGVTITPQTTIHSEGILGYIALDESTAKQVIKRTRQITKQVQAKIAKRAIVYPTGSEVKYRIIQDTNTPMIIERLKQAGYQPTSGSVLNDDQNEIANTLSEAIQEGYGLIIITGGVGAEDKDQTVEAIQKITPHASTPYIIKYKKGTRRHHKDGVKIAVAKLGPSTIIALPGPNDEAQAGLETALNGIKKGYDTPALAAEIARSLKLVLKQKIHGN